MSLQLNKVTNFETYLEQLPRLDEKMEGNVFYRGQSKIYYKLTPSVFRDGFKQKEHEVYTQIMIECSHEFEECKFHNEILSKMQHYGVPTRLLDVTTNALVALYFACENNWDEDGAVYVIKADKSKIKQYDSDAITILSSLPRFNYEEKEEILQLAKTAYSKYQRNLNYETIKNFNKEPIIKRLLHEIKKEKPAFENVINPEDILSNYFLLPRKTNARIIRQSGAFIIFGLRDEEMTQDNNMEFNKLIISKDSKRFIIDQLKNFGISKATLHPELYKVAEYIKEKYRVI